MAIYYISPNGSDSNSGTQASPWLSLHKALSIGTGDTALFADGTYQVQAGGEFTSCMGTLKSLNRWGAKITQQAGATTGSQMITSYNDGFTIDGFDISGPDVQEVVVMHQNVFTIQNCWLHDICNNLANQGSAGGAIVQDQSSSNYANPLTGPYLIQNNLITNVGPKSGGVIQQNNLIHPIYVNCNMTAQSSIQNNLCINCSGIGVNLYHNPQNWLVTNNTLVACLTDGIDCWGDPAVPYLADHNIIQNNIIMACGPNKAIYSPSANCGTHNVFRNNLAFGSYATTYILGTQSSSNLANADPQFVNYQADGSGNYHLKATSPAIDTGTATLVPSVDFEGNSRPQGAGYDVGAYEYGVPPAWSDAISIMRRDGKVTARVRDNSVSTKERA